VIEFEFFTSLFQANRTVRSHWLRAEALKPNNQFLTENMLNIECDIDRK